MQFTGIFTKGGRLCAGQTALLEASEQAWWPLWQQTLGPRWERVVRPRCAEAWRVEPFAAADLQRTAACRESRPLGTTVGESAA